MLERIDYFQFALETLVLGRVANHGLVGDFNGNFTAPDDVKSPVNIAHAPLGQVRLDLVLVELIAYL
jgi:hypothetical protein